MKEYPDSKYKEDIYYYILVSNYKYAKNSITSKQKERYQKTISSYKKLIEKFPQSKYLKEAESIFKITQKELSKFNNNNNLNS